MPFQPGTQLRTTENYAVTVGQHLKTGAQGSVYRVQADIQGQRLEMAMKWYGAAYLQAERTIPNHEQNGLWPRLHMMKDMGPPSPEFCWPTYILADEQTGEFGYLMPLAPPKFVTLSDLGDTIDTIPFTSLTRACMHIADALSKLHLRGLVYMDASTGNFMMDPATGDIRVIDNDNVSRNGTPSIIRGTPGFQAPELITTLLNSPDRQTDYFSLALIFFWIFGQSHPFEGRLVYKYPAFDPETRNRELYAKAPYVWHPTDQSNRPQAEPEAPDGCAGQALMYYVQKWPTRLFQAFEDAFVKGQTDKSSRPASNIWVRLMRHLHDTSTVCDRCSRWNFVDTIYNFGQQKCWACQQRLEFDYLQFLSRNGKTDANRILILREGARLFSNHISSRSSDYEPYRFNECVGEVRAWPKSDGIRYGIRNNSQLTWHAQSPTIQPKYIDPNVLVPLLPDITFTMGDVRAIVCRV